MNFVTNVLKKYIQNDSQESGKDHKVPEVMVLSPDKENGPATENSDPAKAGCGNKLRLSFLKTFDPLYSESPDKSEAKLETKNLRPQLIIEDSDSDRSQSPLPADVSDDDAFVDATYIAASDDEARDEPQPKNKHHELEESLLKFYTPEKFNPIVSKTTAKSTSEPASKESVLSENKEPVSTSVGNQSLEEVKLSDSEEGNVRSPTGDISETKKLISSEKESNEPDQKRAECVEPGTAVKEKDESSGSAAEANNAGNISDSTYSEISDIKTDSPDKSKENSENEELITDSSGVGSIEKEPKSENHASGVSSLEKETNSENRAETGDKLESAEKSSADKEASDSFSVKGSHCSCEAFESRKSSSKSNEHTDEESNDVEPKSENDSVQEIVEKVVEFCVKTCEDTVKDSEVDEGFKSEEEKVSEDLNKTNGIEKAEIELSEKSQEPVKPKEETGENVVPSPKEETNVSSEEDSDPLVEKETVQRKQDFDEKEATQGEGIKDLSDQKSKEELNETFEVRASEEEVKLESEENVATEKQKTEDEAKETSHVEIHKTEEAEKVEPEEKEAIKESSEDIPIKKTSEEANDTFETTKPIDDSTTEVNTTVTIHPDEEQHLDSGVESIEGSYTKSSKSSVDELEGGNISESKEDTNLSDDVLEECKVDSDDHITSDDDSKTISEGSLQSDQFLSETKAELDKVEVENQEVSEKSEGKSEDTSKSVATKPAFDADFYKLKMADLSEKLSEQQQENSDLKLQLNASQQAKASLELEIRQKEEIIIKTQAEALKNEQIFKQEIKQLREKLKENSKLIEKDGSKELEEQLKEAKAREAKAIAELNQRNKDDLNYRKIMEEYENTIATCFSDCQKLKEEHETATRHLANIELAFSDVHQKYERTKAILEGFKANEETLTLNLQASEKTCKQHEEKYESLKAYAKAQIEKSNKEVITLRDRFEGEISKLKAIIKRLEIKCSSLEVSLQQKTEECAALSALCDEVTGKRV